MVKIEKFIYLYSPFKGMWSNPVAAWRIEKTMPDDVRAAKKIWSDGWYLGGFENEVREGAEAEAKQRTLVWLPAYQNLEMTLLAGGELELPFWSGEAKSLSEVRIDGRTHVDNVFCEDNLHSRDEGKYVFRTRYSHDLSKVLPRSALWEQMLPGDRHAYFLDKIPSAVKEIAEDVILKGVSKEDLRAILERIHSFISTHEKIMSLKHEPKSLDSLVDEYMQTGSFSGSCKERELFATALCTSLGIPSRRIYGKSYEPCSHVWAEAYAPTTEGHIWVPLCALTEFNTLSPYEQILWSNVPPIQRPPLASRAKNAWRALIGKGERKKSSSSAVTLSVRRI